MLLQLVLACAVFHAASPAHGTRQIEIEGVFGFGGYYREETPTPLKVIVRSPYEKVEGRALVNMHGWVPPSLYSKDVNIPPGGSQELEFACYGCFGLEKCPVPLEIRSSSGALLAERTFEGYPLREYDTLLVHLGEPSSDLASLRRGDNPGAFSGVFAGLGRDPNLLEYPPRIFPVTMRPDELPENALLMDGVGLVAMNLSTWLSLAESEQEMLCEYARFGGNLLVYFDEETDPVTGWSGDGILPVDPSGSVVHLRAANVEAAVRAFAPELVDLPALTLAKKAARGPHGEVVTADSNEVLDESALPLWERPAEYAVLSVTSDGYSEVFTVERSPILVVKSAGSGNVAFSAFNPFQGSPAATDFPLALLARYGLLEPYGITGPASQESLMRYSIAPSPGAAFFTTFGMSRATVLMGWLRRMGAPVVIYLAGLVVFAWLARGNAGKVLVLLIGWSILMTGVTMYQRNQPFEDTVRIRTANVVWCNASELPEGASSRLQSMVFYSADSPAPRTISFGLPGCVLDETVDPSVWPYGSLTIEQGATTNLPDLPLEQAALGAAQFPYRVFTCRSPFPELTASGSLTLSADTARLSLKLNLPFPTDFGKLLVSSTNLWIAENLGPLEGEAEIQLDLQEGVNITRKPGLFPDLPQEPPGEIGTRPEARGGTTEIASPLRALWDAVYTIPVSLDQKRTTSRVTGRPLRAYVMLASPKPAAEISLERGNLDRQDLTIVVLSVPILYQE